MPTPRLAPLPMSEFDDDARDAVGKMISVDGEPINIFATLARHPKMLAHWHQLRHELWRTRHDASFTARPRGAARD